MKVQVKDLPNCSREIDVEVSADMVQKEIGDIYQRILQDAKVDGFRKGKAPLTIIKQRYKDTVKREMEETVLPRYFQAALEKEKLHPVSKPRIKDHRYEESGPLKFTVYIEVRPEFELKNYKGYRIKKVPIEITEEDVDKGLSQLREYSAQYIPAPDRPVEKGDLVIADFEGRLNDTILEGGKASRHPIHVGSGDMIPGFEDAIIGLPMGGTRSFPIVFPGEYPKKDVAGKEVQFTVTVHEIKKKQLPVVDEEFAKSAAGCDTVTQLRDKIKGQIAQAKENEQRTRMLEQVTEKLLKEHKYDVPDSWVSLEAFHLIRNGLQQLRQHGVDPNHWDQKQKNEFNDKMKQQAERNVRIAVVIDRIAEAEKIDCQDVDWDAYIKKMSANTGQAPEAIKHGIQKQGRMDDIKERIRHEKTMDFLLDVAQIEYK